tara:strand:+ start:362 stop:1390 length:1029 start_codon:yes stop_codon:yes gene_type:complete
MGGSNLTDYAKFLKEDIPEDIAKIHEHFTIEISIVMRKPKGHFSRAPGVILDILNTFEGGTFFQGQGFWRGVQEPIIYILISKQDNVKLMIELLKNKIENAQLKLLQQEMFVKINGCSFIGSLIDKKLTKTFPDQWEFDDDMKRITANQSRIDEHHKLIYGRVDYHRKKYGKAQEKWTEMINQFAKKDKLSENEKRDLLKCYTNILSPKLNLDDAFVEQICKQFNTLLPLKKDSSFSPEILSKHAEARMRGNRIKLFSTTGLGNVSKEDLAEDGVFAINQIATHLESGSSPYLENDPIKDIQTIIKHINTISNQFNPQIKPIIQSLTTKFPKYEDDLSELIL